MMTKVNRNILVVCYRFPPNPGIGGRRWAKFAKELARREFQVHVICVQPDRRADLQSAWLEDVNSPNIHLHTLPRRYPASFDRQFVCDKLGISDRIAIRICRKILPFLTRGSIYDRTIFWRKPLAKVVKRIVQEFNPQTVVSTGAPFRQLAYLSEMKANGEIPHLICDFRDPWVGSRDYGFDGLTESDYKHESECEELVYKHADYLIAPNEYLVDAHKYGLDLSDRKRVIPHAFDPDDFGECNENQNGLLTLSYAGSLYRQIRPSIEGVANSLDNMKNTSPKLYSNLRLNIYSDDRKMESLFDGHQDTVFFHDLLPSRTVISKLQQSTFNLFFTASHSRNWMTTKAAELIAAKRPILIFGPKGSVSDLVEKNQCGFALEPNEIENTLATVLSDPANRQILDGNLAARFSLPEITDQLIELFP